MDGETCLVNIGPRGRRQRAWIAGAMALVLAAGILLAARHDVARSWRLLAFLPLLLGALGLFQATAGT